MGWLDDAEEALGFGDEEAAPEAPPQVVRAEPAAAQSAWESASSWASQQASSAQQAATEAWDQAAATVEAAVESADPRQTVQADPEAAASAWDTATDWASQQVEEVAAVIEDADVASADPSETVQADPDMAQAAWDTAADWVSQEAAEVAAVVDDGATWVSDNASQFATNAQTQFEADPVGFVSDTITGTHVDYDDDASDGTLGLHVRSGLGSFDGQWKDGEGSKTHGVLGADWGSAPYLATDMTTDDNGDITKLSGTAKVTVPLEVADLKAEATAGYEQTADGYKASASESTGVNVRGVEIMDGLHGGIQDHGDHGATVNVGHHGSVGAGRGPIPGMDLAEGAIKGSNDVSYGELDGQTTVNASTTVGGEVKVVGQTIAQGQNTVGVEYTEGPQGERVSGYDTVSGTVGNQNLGGGVSVSEQARYTYGTDAQGNEVSQVTMTTQATQTDGSGNQTPLVNDTDTYDVETPDVTMPVTLPDGSSEEYEEYETDYVADQPMSDYASEDTSSDYGYEDSADSYDDVATDEGATYDDTEYA